MMEAIDWMEIHEAHEIVARGGSITKIEGDFWKLYRVGSNIIRLDIQVKEQTNAETEHEDR